MIGVDQTLTQSYLNSQTVYSNYYIDEPYENNVQPATMVNIAYWISLINPNAQFFFSDWYWPDFDLACSYYGNGNYLITYFFPNSNVHIMCDQYAGNGCVSPHQYWDRYKSDYGYQQRNKSNWVSLDYSFDWVELLTVAKGYSSPGYFDHFWVYGDDPDVNESFIQLFDSYAYSTGWISNYQLQAVNVYQNQTVGSCTFPGSNWQLINTYYTGVSRWAHF